MKILVTGGAGFIGSNVADEFIAQGHEVVIVDDLSTGFQNNVPKEATFYPVDIRDPDLSNVFEKEKPEVVDHHAAQIDVRKSVVDPMFDAQVNVLGSLNVLQQCVKHGVKKVLYASTGGAVYGEPDYLPADEKHPIRPLCQYGITKHTVEHYLYLYHHNYGLDYTVLRYPNVYGPRQDPHGEAGVVAIFTEALFAGQRPTIFGDGTHTRDYVFVGDIARANHLALEAGSGQVINLGWGREISVNDICTCLKKHLGVEIEPIYAEERLGEIHRICLNGARAQEQLHWQPQVALDEGIRRTVEYYRSRQGEAR
ncbi:NAD-dependent epimerase/dehydratase family protein [Candidatus Zixiibacteriota bacterium]